MHKKKSISDKESYPWRFISGVKQNKESFEKTMLRRVEKEAGIKIENIKQISEYYYHAQLTDDNVNKIIRKENQLLNFYSLKESKALFLSKLTREFILRHGSVIQLSS